MLFAFLYFSSCVGASMKSGAHQYGSSFHEKSYDNNTGLRPFNEGGYNSIKFSTCLLAWYKFLKDSDKRLAGVTSQIRVLAKNS